MAGIYIHIPFCKQACHYCNFHFSTSLRRKTDLLEAILLEMEWRRDYLPEKAIDTIYLGGGTPSLLTRGDLERLFEHIHRYFDIAENAEVTLEANPDDLTQEYLKDLSGVEVNRLSIGVQSFHEEDLRFFNRAHNAIEARACIEYAQDLGFTNLTIDLIYGSPSTSLGHWEQNLQITFDYEIPHISAYGLTVEERTALAHQIQNGKVPAPDEEAAARQFELLMRAMRAEGYQHYEISNFALPGWHARHNAGYWTGEPYLGLGPSAHSFDGISRQWNVAHNQHYIKRMKEPPKARADAHLFEREVLSPVQRYNEYILTALRTMWGCRLKLIDPDFRPHFLEHIQAHIRVEHVERKGDAFRLTDRGKLLADRIALDLFLEMER